MTAPQPTPDSRVVKLRTFFAVEDATVRPTNWHGIVGDFEAAGLLVLDPDRAVDVLVAHQRRDIGGCLCGWSDLGKSHPEHVIAMLRGSR